MSSRQLCRLTASIFIAAALIITGTVLAAWVCVVIAAGWMILAHFQSDGPGAGDPVHDDCTCDR